MRPSRATWSRWSVVAVRVSARAAVQGGTTMATEIPVEAFRGGLLLVLEEIFEKVHGAMLDPGDSLFETLATISAEDASRPISAQSANLAAQVNHVWLWTQ